MTSFTMARERVKVMTNPTLLANREGFRWVVYCGMCDPRERMGLDGLFWGLCLGGTNNWTHAIRYATEHAATHETCGECGRIKPAQAAADIAANNPGLRNQRETR